MKGPFSVWQKTILDRFSERENIGSREVYIRYFRPLGLGEECVMECLELIETEYGLSAGLIRPQDKVSQLVDPVKAKTPWCWLFYRSREEDIQSELNYQLDKRMRRHGTLGSWSHIDTLSDLVKAWCGRKPD
jgi:hypothetical protein